MRCCGIRPGPQRARGYAPAVGSYATSAPTGKPVRSGSNLFGHGAEIAGHVPEIIGHDAETTGHALPKYAIDSTSRPVVHSDRGAHYRWPGWLARIADANLTRSMSRKGCSPDNAACEGFFGRLKTEWFYPGNWQSSTVEQFVQALELLHPLVQREADQDLLGCAQSYRLPKKLGLHGITSPRIPPHPHWLSFRTWTAPEFARLSIHGGSKEKIAPVHSDLIAACAAVPDGIRWLTPLSVGRTLRASETAGFANHGLTCLAITS